MHFGDSVKVCTQRLLAAASVLCLALLLVLPRSCAFIPHSGFQIGSESGWRPHTRRCMQSSLICTHILSLPSPARHGRAAAGHIPWGGGDSGCLSASMGGSAGGVQGKGGRGSAENKRGGKGRRNGGSGKKDDKYTDPGVSVSKDDVRTGRRYGDGRSMQSRGDTVLELQWANTPEDILQVAHVHSA